MFLSGAEIIYSSVGLYLEFLKDLKYLKREFSRRKCLLHFNN